MHAAERLVHQLANDPFMLVFVVAMLVLAGVAGCMCILFQGVGRR